MYQSLYIVAVLCGGTKFAERTARVAKTMKSMLNKSLWSFYRLILMEFAKIQKSLKFFSKCLKKFKVRSKIFTYFINQFACIFQYHRASHSILSTFLRSLTKDLNGRMPSWADIYFNWGIRFGAQSQWQKKSVILISNVSYSNSLLIVWLFGLVGLNFCDIVISSWFEFLRQRERGKGRNRRICSLTPNMISLELFTERLVDS